MGFLFFAWIPPLLLLRPSAASVRRAAFTTHHSPTSHTSLITAQLININHLTSHSTTHHSSTSHTSLITSPPLTAPLLTPHFSHLTYHILTSHITYHTTTRHSSTSRTSLIILSQHNSSQLRGQQIAFLVAGAVRLPFAWQAQYTEPPGRAAHAWARPSGAAAFRVAGAVHRASWSSCRARGRRWAAAAFRVAGAVHRASWLGAACVGAAGLRLPFVWQAQYTAAARVGAAQRRGCLSCDRRSTQSLLVELWRTWAPLGRGGCRVAGGVHRASWSSCGSVYCACHTKGSRAAGPRPRVRSSTRRLCVRRLPHDNHRGPAAPTCATARPGGSVYCACHTKGSRAAGPRPRARQLCTAPATRKAAAAQRRPRTPHLTRRLCVLRLPHERQPRPSVAHARGSSTRRLCVLRLPRKAAAAQRRHAHARSSSTRRLCVLRLPHERQRDGRCGKSGVRSAWSCDEA